MGGICESSAVAEVSQDIDLRDFDTWIETGEAGLRFAASMATWAKHDIPEAWVEIRDGQDDVIYTSRRLSSKAATWTQQEIAVPVPQAQKPPVSYCGAPARMGMTMTLISMT